MGKRTPRHDVRMTAELDASLQRLAAEIGVHPHEWIRLVVEVADGDSGKLIQDLIRYRNRWVNDPK